MAQEKSDAGIACARGPFRGFGGRRWPVPGFRPGRRPPSESACRSEFRTRKRSGRIGFSAPAVPLALAPAVRFSACGLGHHAFARAPSSLRLEPSPEVQPRRRLADRPEPVGSSHGLLVPYSTSGPGDPLAAGFPSPLRSALRVWLPSRRFAPSKPVPALFHAGGAHGVFPFGAFPSREVSRAFPPAKNPPAVSPPGIPAARSGRAGPGDRGFGALPLAGVPRGRSGLYPAGRRMLPWGSSLPGLSGRQP